MKKKTVLIILSVLIVIAIAAIPVYRYCTVRAYRDKVFPLPDNYSELPVESSGEAQVLFDASDKRLMSGYSDRIIVAHIDEIVGTVYPKVHYLDDGELYASPYTQYLIQNCSNIKGHLRTDVPIPVLDYGGVSIDGTHIVEGAPPLKAGYFYVLYLFVDVDGIYLRHAETLGSDAKTDINALLAGTQRDQAFRVYCECLEGYKNEDLTYAPKETLESEYEMNEEQIAIEEAEKSGTTIVYYDPEIDTTAPIDYSVERTTEAP